MTVYLFPRLPCGDAPGGLTVSKRRRLPTGDFHVTEYTWGNVSLWFVDADKFTADERQEVFETWCADDEEDAATPLEAAEASGHNPGPEVTP